MAPLISVVVPVHNGASYIDEALGSAFRQEFADFEVIVVDDASTDGTAACVARYAPAVRVLYFPDQRGPARARNAAIAQASGRWVAFLDADDRWRPEKLARQVVFAGNHSDFGVITTDAASFGDEGTLSSSLRWRYPIRGKRILRRLLFNNWVTTSATLVPRDLLLRVGGFPEAPCRLGEDWLLWMRIAAERPIYFLDEVLTERRVHENSLGNLDEEGTFHDLLGHFESLRQCMPQLRDGEINRAAARLCRIRGCRNLQELTPGRARAKFGLGLRYTPFDPRLWLLAAVTALPPPWLRLSKRALACAKRQARRPYCEAVPPERPV